VESAVVVARPGKHPHVAAVSAACGLVVLTGFLIADCGGSSNSPSPVSQSASTRPPSSGPSINVAPVIESISASADRVEVDNDITLTAVVKDQETPIDQLKFDWAADAGTFTGDGAVVQWHAPKDIKTPADVDIHLTVTETYGSPDASGVRPQNVATSSYPAIRVHNSPKELGDLSIQFLTDFAHSDVQTDTCLRDFSDSCKGKAEERSDIDSNRVHYEILSSSLSLRGVTVAASGLTAKMTVACSFTSKTKVCDAGDKSCVVGDVGTARGDCILTGTYENRRWWLCDSHFNGRLADSMRLFFGRSFQ
jgi:hypothetical protein